MICCYFGKSLLSWVVRHYKNRRIRDPKDKGNSPPFIIIHQVSQFSLSFLTDKTIKDTQDQHSWTQLHASLLPGLPTNIPSAVPLSNHPRRRRRANENQKKHHKTELDNLRPFSVSYLQNEGVELQSHRTQFIFEHQHRHVTLKNWAMKA